ncbi:uncharacterized protein Pten isoform X2 [Drosophila tropicalis]|uniref:uncharacterized protein Pten isoform X2 n=1 Tax=Drosophila tropicalis TaxID=46794 RepID=UPI0035ABD2A9
MANTISLMSNVIRNVVSKKRIRYKENGFNLDLTYICENIIAMGYPASDKFEGLYRNRFEDVFKFLEENHGQHYKIYNLCLEREYDINKFHGRVAIYPFKDHNPPTIELIQRFCQDVDSWLKEDSLNVVAVHCKAGKGRTGTMICAYLLYSGMQKTADEALAWYDEKRTKDCKGVTIPSQRRYVQYFANLICSRVLYKTISLNVCEIRFAGSSFLRNMGMVQCSVFELEDSTNEMNLLETWSIDFRRTFVLDISNSSLTVAGDIKVELSQSTKSSTKYFCHFWFNTFFVQNSAVCETFGNSEKFMYTLKKSEIDDAHKDREHKLFSEDFKVSIVFEGIPIEPTKKMHKNKFRNREENNFAVSSSSRFSEASGASFELVDGTADQQIENLELDETLTNNQTNDGVSTHSRNPSTAFKRKQPSTKSIPLTANNTISKNDTKKLHIVNQQPSAKNSGFVKWQNDANITPKTRDLNDSSGNILKCVGGGSIKSLDQDPYITCSKQRSSPHANHNHTGEGDEDWESEKTNCNNHHQQQLKITLREKSPNKNITTNPNQRLDKLANEKFLSNIQDNQQQQRYDHDHHYDHLKIPLMIQNSSKDVQPNNNINGRKVYTLPRPLMKAKMMPSCIKKLKKNKTNKLITSSQNLQRLQNYFKSDSAKIFRNFITYRRNTFAGRKSKPNNSTTIPLSSSFSSSAASSSKSSAPSSSSSSSSSGAVIATHSSSCPIIFKSTNINLMKTTIEKSKSTSALLTFKSPLHHLFTVDGGERRRQHHSDDYYSNICDNLLSLNNSPCKSSRLLIAGSSLENAKYFAQNRNNKMTTTTTTTANHNNSNSNVIIVCTKPAETMSIGFNTETQINCLQEKKPHHCIFNETKPYTFPDLNRVVDNINMEENNTQHTISPPDLFYSVDFNNTYHHCDYEIKTKSTQTPNNLDILGLDEDKSKDISSNVNVTTNYAEN